MVAGALTLAAALGVAGGRTTAMFEFAGELASCGRCVVTTTTNRIDANEIGLAPLLGKIQGDASLAAARAIACQAIPNARLAAIVPASAGRPPSPVIEVVRG